MNGLSEKEIVLCWGFSSVINALYCKGEYKRFTTYANGLLMRAVNTNKTVWKQGNETPSRGLKTLQSLM